MLRSHLGTYGGGVGANSRASKPELVLTLNPQNAEAYYYLGDLREHGQQRKSGGSTKSVQKVNKKSYLCP